MNERQIASPWNEGANFAYESYRFSDELQARQALLRAAEWSASIEESARVYGWLHLLVRKDAPHPATIPLARLFENDEYAVFRFDTAAR